ncbi:hypothetical protein Leryth_014823 [Lithospermum erythrorhizon]|nr:hypothetical protein Leryth_014823 [Lithospermum erythrorhizon]
MIPRILELYKVAENLAEEVRVTTDLISGESTTSNSGPSGIVTTTFDYYDDEIEVDLWSLLNEALRVI